MQEPIAAFNRDHHHMNRNAFLLILCVAVVLAAETTRVWRQDRFEDFEKGTATNVSMRSDGRLLLAPRFRTLNDPQLNYAWALVEDSKGRIYVGGGSPSKVVRLTPDSRNPTAEPKSETVFSGKELEIHGLAVDGQDNVYAATSPDPKIYKITPDGKSSVFFEPKAKYVWAMAWDPTGFLYVATGDQGEIFRVDRDGKGQLFYNNEDTHIRSMVFDSRTKTLVVGTEPSGLIMRITPGPDGSGKGFVLYQAAKKEVTALAVAADGSIYGAAVGDKPPRVLPSAPAPAPAPAGILAAPAFVPGQVPPVQGGTEVYRIFPDGSPRRVWVSRDDVVYSMALSAAGKPLLGTGNKGRLYQLDSDVLFTTLLKTPASQVTTLLRSSRGVVYVATGNIGKVFELGSEYEKEGTFESEAFDARNFSRWGALRWENQQPTGSTITLSARSGNVDNPDRNWSAWSQPVRNALGEAPSIPGARFVQWKVVLSSSDGKTSPLLDSVEIAYMPKNLPPSIDEVEATPGGYRFNFPPPPPANQPQPLTLPGLGQPRSPIPPVAVAFNPPAQMLAQKGAQGVRWAARDDNDDQLAFTLYIKGTNEANWKLLKEKTSDRFYSWDANTFPDGKYLVKVVASDAPSNTEQDALTDEKISTPFEIDNTPPSILNLKGIRESNRIRVTFRADDAMSVIRRAECSVDGGDWQVVLPQDMLTDSLQEDYSFLTSELSPGEHTIAVRVSDKVDNVQVDKVVVK